MTTNVQAFIDAGDIFDIAVDERRLLHFNGGQAHIWMWKNRNTVLSIDFTSANTPKIDVSLNAQYIQDNKHNCAHYQEHYKTHSMKVWNYNFYKNQEEQNV